MNKKFIIFALLVVALFVFISLSKNSYNNEILDVVIECNELDSIDTPLVRDLCIINYARQMNNIELCEYIKDKTSNKVCKAHIFFRDYSESDCLKEGELERICLDVEAARRLD